MVYTLLVKPLHPLSRLFMLESLYFKRVKTRVDTQQGLDLKDSWKVIVAHSVLLRPQEQKDLCKWQKCY